MTEPSDAIAPPPVQPPDWSLIPIDILCPLCEYNLRGLSEPRCPECGFAFSWQELLDAERQRHPYLFEHHPNQNIGSFWKTAAGGLRPRRFWKTLTPLQPSKPRRLIAYWIIASLVGVLGFASLDLQAPIDRTFIGPGGRTWSGFWLSQPPGWLSRWFISFNASVLKIDISGYVVTIRPEDFWALGCALLVLWPAGTLLALMIFQASMRLAKVRRHHVIRCVVYSADAGFWAGLIGIALITIYTLYCIFGTPPSVPMVAFYVLLLVALGPVFAWRLSVAYRLYLRFDHPLATVVCTQLILLLVLACAVLYLHFM